MRCATCTTSPTSPSTEAVRWVSSRLAAAGGSEYASLALAYRHAFGVGQPEDCPAGGAMYERAALSAAASLDTRRRTSVEQTNPAEPDHAVLLSRAMPDRERVDKAAVEYMDYCAQVGDPAGRVGMGHLHHSGAHGVPKTTRQRVSGSAWRLAGANRWATPTSG